MSSSGEHAHDEDKPEHVTVTLDMPSPMSFSGSESSAPAMDLAPTATEEDEILPPNSPVSSSPGPYPIHPPYISIDLCECGGIEPHYHQATMNGAGGGGDATTSLAAASTGPARRNSGRLPNHVQVAKSYVFEQEIQKCLRDTGVAQAREDSIRLAGVQWIDNARRALKL